jgi:hypothetical protein
VDRRRRVPFAKREGLRIAPGAWHTHPLQLAGERFMTWFDDAPRFAAPRIEVLR